MSDKGEYKFFNPSGFRRYFNYDRWDSTIAPGLHRWSFAGRTYLCSDRKMEHSFVLYRSDGVQLKCIGRFKPKTSNL